MADYGNPFAPGDMNPNMARNGLYDLRMMSAANRMEQPFMHSPHAYRSLGSNPMLASMMEGPDYSQFTFDPTARATASSALTPYGLAPLEAGQVRQNSILPNTGFFGNHPRLSAALEGGVYGALASHGGNTVGESIQGALEGLVGGRQLQQAAYNRQFAKPFEAAGAMERLEDLKQKRDLQEAEIQHYRALNQKLGKPDHDFRAVPLTKADPGYVSYDATTGKGEYVKNPDYDPSLVATRTGSNLWSGMGHLEPYARAHGWHDPNIMDQSQWQTVKNEYNDDQFKLAYGRSRNAAEGRDQAPGHMTPELSKNVDMLRSEINKLDTKEASDNFLKEIMLDPKAPKGPGVNIMDEVNKRKEQKRQDLKSKIYDLEHPASSDSGMPTPVTSGATDQPSAGGAIKNTQGDPSLINSKIVPPGTPKRGVGPNYIMPGGNTAKPPAGRVLVEGKDFNVSKPQ